MRNMLPRFLLLLLLLGLLAGPAPSWAQVGATSDWAWATQLGPSAGSNRTGFVNGVAADAAGNVTIGGEFDPDLRFAGSPLVLGTNRPPDPRTGFTYTNGFLAQYRADGQLNWTLNLESQGGRVVDVAADAAGNLYALGYCNRGLVIGGALVVATPGPRAFLLKVSAAGIVQWASDVVEAGYGVSDGQGNWKLAVDAAGNSVVFGTYRGSLTVGTQTYTSPVAYTKQPFLVRVNAAGQVAGSWAGQQPKGDDDARFYNGLALSPTGDVYLAGWVFDATLLFGNLPPVAGPTNTPRSTGFLVKISSANIPEWVLVGTLATPTAGNYFDDVKVSAAGHVYALGGMSTNPLTLGTQTVPNPNNDNAFVLRLTPEGTIRRSATGTLSPRGLALGPHEDLYIVTLVNAVRWGAVQLTAPAGAQQQVSVLRLDSTGRALQGWLASGPAIARQPRLAVDGLGQATVASWLYGTGTFTFGTRSATAPDLWGMFVARTSAPVLAVRAAQAVPGLALYPNPARQTVTVGLARAAPAQVQLFDMLGRLVRTQALPGPGPLDLRALPAGVYQVRVQQGPTQSYRHLTVMP
ncbi:T9SS type A sorting domain-containing protein [Hymenobacter rubripertinctus]|uniref:T9SS C-terminal target domain-containing protein n=1 Tax=Hymenobacter rubripertinctus TaxID=2029981 RepID=A0A418R2G2_9BACT|nr:T9SS type A sorting domain-containing protein [Hymenobacter rubripertinctus]RIY11541.1 T9SS C-terminal target domain-containing protein [Hymenobacter rubripertinctus]